MLLQLFRIPKSAPDNVVFLQRCRELLGYTWKHCGGRFIQLKGRWLVQLTITPRFDTHSCLQPSSSPDYSIYLFGYGLYRCSRCTTLRWMVSCDRSKIQPPTYRNVSNPTATIFPSRDLPNPPLLYNSNQPQRPLVNLSFLKVAIVAGAEHSPSPLEKKRESVCWDD